MGGGTLLFRVGALVMACVSALFCVVVFTDRGFVKEPVLVIDNDKLERELTEVFSADEEEDVNEDLM